MNPEEEQMYQLGRQAREAGYPIGACNVRDLAKRSFWTAGWHDLDMEMGVRVYTGPEKTLEAA